MSAIRFGNLRVELETLLAQIRAELINCPPIYAAEFFGDISIESELMEAICSGILEHGWSSTRWPIPDSAAMMLFGVKGDFENACSRISKIAPQIFVCVDEFREAAAGAEVEKGKLAEKHREYPLLPAAVAICSAVRFVRLKEPESMTLPIIVEGEISYKNDRGHERVIYPGGRDVVRAMPGTFFDPNSKYQKAWNVIREELPKKRISASFLKTPLLQSAALVAARLLARIEPANSTENLQKPVRLNDTEVSIIEAVGSETLIGEAIAKKLHYPYNSNFKAILSSLRKRGILENMSPGYRVAHTYRKS